ncbi:MAG TPA: DGQHR domain-containing protein [Longimicrobium sp.]|jgi:DGQHR domain-containing protein|uniref:DGQHR domain-containing protein n=1 Tax=Longimicrobium sp. TaxID=2029185 RepID=UPI002EDA8BAA
MIHNVHKRPELIGFARQQALDEDRQTIRAEHLTEAEADGWTVRKRNKNSVSVKRAKRHDAQLRSRVWSLMYRMGFDFLSGKGGTQLDLPKTEGAQHESDVVAIDKEVAVDITCVSFDSAQKDSGFVARLEALVSVRKPFTVATSHIYPVEHKRHVGSVVFVQNVIITDHERDRAAEADISVFDEADLDYFEQLVKLLGPAARYQFLAEVFRGREIAGLEVRVPALRARVGTLTCYTFAIRPDYLLKIAYVAHRAKGKAIDLDAYQRMISKSRLRAIGQYISEEGVFPTNIVVNLEKDRVVQFERGKQEGDTDGALFGWLTLHPSYGAAWIIDGQHRLFAYSGHPRATSSYLNVLAFAGLSASRQAQMFVDINSEQRRMKRSLLVELDAVLKWDSEDDEKRISAVISKAGMVLDEDRESPLHGRLLPADVARTDIRCISLTAFANALDKSGFFLSAKRKGVLEHGPLWREDPSEALRRTARVVNAWLTPIASRASAWWDLGAGEGGGLAMNNGVTVSLNVLRSVFEHLSQQHALLELSDPEISKLISPYAAALGGYFASMSADDRLAFRQLQGVDGQTTGTRMCQAALHGDFPEFVPAGLSDWMERRKANTNEQARSIIDKIEKTLQEVILETLKSEFQQDSNQWWFEGVPQQVRAKIDQRINETDGRAGTREQNFDLIHYRAIIHHQYQLLGDLLGRGKGGKDKRTEWIHEVSSMRNIVMHPSRREFLSFEKLNQLNGHWTWLQGQVAQRDEILTG